MVTKLKYKSSVTGIILAVMLTACAETPSQNFQTESSITPDHNARLIVYRQDLGIEGGIFMKAIVYLDDEKLAILDDNEYAVIYTMAGEHDLKIGSDENVRKETYRITVADKDTQYFEVVNNPNRLPIATFLPVTDIVGTLPYFLEKRSQDDFTALEAQLKPVPKSPATPERAADQE